MQIQKTYSGEESEKNISKIKMKTSLMFDPQPRYLGASEHLRVG